MRRFSLGLLVITNLACGGVATNADEPQSTAWWDIQRAEMLEWLPDDAAYAPDRKVEASGLVAADGVLWATVEKFGRLLRIDPETLRAEAIQIPVPPRSEIEGIAWDGRQLLVCDEIHAGLYGIEPGAMGGEGVPAIRTFDLGDAVPAGKSGLEGVAVVGDDQVVMLLERTQHADGSCTADLYRMRREGDRMVTTGAVIELAMEDCAWRLAGLEWWNGRLLGLKTQFPGERYEVVAIDLESGRMERVLEMTDLLRSVRNQGWGNNVEGIAVTPDGALWLIGDNASTDGADGDEPAMADSRSLLLRIPASDGAPVAALEAG
jgi:hypothetical protein